MASERKLDELAADYVNGTLSAEEADEFARLIVERPELRAEVNRLEKTVGLVLNEFPMEMPPTRLRAAILAEFEAPETASKPETASQPSRLVWVLGAFAVGAALLSLALGLSNQRLRLANQQLQQETQQLQQELLAAMPAQEAQLILAEPTTRFYDFAGTDTATGAFGNMIVDTAGLKAAIAFRNLDPLANNETYALWVRYQGQYIPCGDFQPGEDGTAFVTLSMPSVYQSKPWVKDVILTVESTDLPNQPTGPIVAETI